MPLLLVIGIGIVLLLIKMVDKGGKLQHADSARKIREAEEEFRKTYTDIDLENTIIEFITDPQNRNAVQREIDKALSEMDYQNTGLCYLSLDEKIDILLANRGKIGDSEQRRGYEIQYYNFLDKGWSRFCNGYDLEMGKYGLMVWIQNTFRKQGIDLELYVFKSKYGNPIKYAWKGSPYDMAYNNRDEIRVPINEYYPERVSSIPKPYYDK